MVYSGAAVIEIKTGPIYRRDIAPVLTIMMGAGCDRLPWRPEYRAHRDGIALIACGSATPARRNRRKSQPQKSKPKPRLLPFGMFPFFSERSSRSISSCRCDDIKIGAAESFVR